MKVDSLLGLYRAKRDDGKREELISAHVSNKYVPIREKREYAKKIIDVSQGDSLDKYVLTCLTIVSIYTDLEINDKCVIDYDSFDKLNGSGVLDMIIRFISKREIDEFNMVLDMIETN